MQTIGGAAVSAVLPNAGLLLCTRSDVLHWSILWVVARRAKGRRLQAATTTTTTTTIAGAVLAHRRDRFIRPPCAMRPRTLPIPRTVVPPTTPRIRPRHHHQRRRRGWHRRHYHRGMADRGIIVHANSYPTMIGGNYQLATSDKEGILLPSS